MENHESGLPWAEDTNYWKTSKSSPDKWIQRTKNQIENIGGEVLAEHFGSDSRSKRSAFMIEFEADGEVFKVIWPVLPSKYEEDDAARRQAATLLYHDVKSKCISSAVLGTRGAFFTFLKLPDGRCAVELASPDVAKSMPKLLSNPNK